MCHSPVRELYSTLRGEIEMLACMHTLVCDCEMTPVNKLTC